MAKLTPAGTREQLLAAALECFLEAGVEATTLADVRRRSGVSNGSLFHFFPGREELIQAVWLHALARHHAALLPVFRGKSRKPRPVVRGAVRAHLAWVQANPRLAEFLLRFRSAIPAAPGETALAESRAFFRAVEEWLFLQGWRGSPPLDVLVALWTGPANEYALHWLSDRSSQEPKGVASLLADAAWRALEPFLKSAGGDKLFKRVAPHARMEPSAPHV